MMKRNTFKYNDNEMTKEQFETILQKYQEYNYINASYGSVFDFSIENMQKFSKNPLDFINPNEK